MNEKRIREVVEAWHVENARVLCVHGYGEGCPECPIGPRIGPLRFVASLASQDALITTLLSVECETCKRLTATLEQKMIAEVEEHYRAELAQVQREIDRLKLRDELFAQLRIQVQAYYGKDGGLAALQDGHRALESRLAQAKERIAELERKHAETIAQLKTHQEMYYTERRARMRAEAQLAREGEVTK